MIRLSKRGLCMLDMCLWFFAGLKVVLTGYSAWQQFEVASSAEQRLGMPLVVIAVGALMIFRYLIFRPAMRRNLNYIQSREGDLHPFYHCMRPKAWLIMASMIALGMTLRFSGLVPLEYIASFYCGLGFALAATGLDYLPWITNKELQRAEVSGSPSKTKKQRKRQK